MNMVITKRFPARYYTLQDFPTVMAVVIFVVLTIFMVSPNHTCGGSSVDLPRVWNPSSLPRFDRPGAMMLAIMKDGTMFFGTEKIQRTQLAERIHERMQKEGVEKRLYINADYRTRYGNINEALDAIYSSGIEKVAFLADQRKPNSLEDLKPPSK